MEHRRDIEESEASPIEVFVRVKPLTRRERGDIKVKPKFIQNKEALLVSKARDGIRLKIEEDKFRSFRFSRVFSEGSSN